ncbi:hypothetical protein BDK92_1004 [Micromonospora pisi]|uniref:Excreted virulence factor EspC (Type VII ESX diderm) n=1 Tax=Micromonospora pisi TaxID=589240 RepID=A0A495JF93_9ACTN|nr:hypothetical protein [Micromonospora pisi]RKR86739.1 hypothetical protein BDK92_1004 [Micromonospora pisi]
MPRITVDEDFIREVQTRLTEMRNQVSGVRAGVDPTDMGHTHGMPWANLEVIPGGENFASGAAVKTRIRTVGGLVDTKLAAFDKKLADYAQGLGNILLSSENIERANANAANFASFLPGSRPTSSVPPPVVPPPAAS